MPLRKLWSVQGKDHSLTSGKIDVTKSYYLNDPGLLGIKAAYAALRQSLGTDQVIWCYEREDEHYFSRAPDPRRIQWELEVPADGIFARINTPEWEKLVQGKTEPNSVDFLFPNGFPKGTILLRHPVPLAWVRGRQEVIQMSDSPASIRSQRAINLGIPRGA